MSATDPDYRSIQRILALSVETLMRNGLEAECKEAIRQGRTVAQLLGPYPPRDPEAEEAHHVAIRQQVYADASLLDDSVITFPARPKQ